MTETHSIHIKVDSTDAQKASRNLNDMEKATNGAEKALVNLTRAAVGLVTLEALKRTAAYAIEAADSFTLMSSKLKLATSSQEEFTKAQTALFKIAQANSTELASTVDLYTRVSRGMKEMGSSQADILKMTNAVGQALKISGASTSEASSVITQFGQALGSGVLRGEEFNAIMENGNRLARALADGLGVPLGSLRKLAEQGQLTGDIVTKAILSQTAALNSEASTMQTTVSQAWTQLENAVVTYIGEADQANGTTKDLSEAIVTLAKNFTDLADPIANALSYIAKVEVGGWIALSEAIGTAKVALQEMVGIQQAGTADPEILKLMKMGQGQMSLDEIAGKQAEVTEKTVAKASAATGIHLANTGKAAKKAADEAQKAFQETIEANVKAAENAARILSAQMDSKKKRYEIEAEQIKGNAELEIRRTKSESMRLAIAEEAQTKIIEAINEETNLRQAGLEKEIETIQVKLSGVQQEIDAADAHKLKQSERIELTTKLSEIETELAVKRQERTTIELDAIGQIQSAERDLAEARQQAEETMVKEEALRQLEIMSSNLEYAKEMATGLAEAFGEVGAAIGGMSVAMAEYDKQSATIEIARKEAVDKAEGDQKRITEINDDATKKQAKAQIKAYGDMTQAAQGFFKKGSKGYEAMGAAVKVFRAFEMAQSAMSMVKQMSDMGSILAQFLGMETTKTTAKIASNSAQQASDASGAVTSATKAVADAGQGDPYTGIIRAAAMLAFMAAIGIAVGGGGGGGSAPATPPPEPGTGTVKGDPFAVSESISKSIGIIEENSSNDLNYSADMLDALYQIRDALGGVENLIASNLTPAISNLMLKFGDGVKQAGFVFRDQRLDKVLASGRLEGYIGARIETESSQMMVTIKKGQTMVAQYGDLFEKAFGGVVTAIKDSIVEVGKVIGVTDAEITERLKGFKIKLGTIDIAGLSAEEAAKKIEAAFSAMSDTMAMKALPEFKDFQQTGEGYKETIVRVAEGINRAKGSLELLGMEAINYTDITNKNKDVAAEITRQTIMAQGDLSEGTRKYVEQLQGGAADIIDSYKQILSITNLMRGAGFGAEDLDRTMINAAGGLAAFEESLQSFRENFMTDEQRLAADTQELSKAFADLNMGLPSSKEQFYEIAKGIDKTTEEGKKLFAQFMTLNPKFAEYIDLSKELADAQEEAFQKEWDRVEAEKAKAKELQDRFESLYFTPQERLNKQMDKLREQFDEMGLTVPKTKDEFRGLVEGLDLTTSNGKRLHDILLGLAPAFSDAANEADKLADAAKKAAEAEYQAALKAHEDLIKGLQDTANKSLNDMQSAYQELQKVQERFINTARTLRTYLTELSGLQASPERRYEASAMEFRRVASLAAQGNEGAINQLSDVGKEFLDASREYNASSVQFQKDREEVTKAVTEAIAYSEQQVDIAQLQLSAAEKSYGELLGIKVGIGNVTDGVLSVANGVNNLIFAMNNYQSAVVALASAKTAAPVTPTPGVVIPTPAPIPEPIPMPRPTLIPSQPTSSVPTVPGGRMGYNPFFDDTLQVYNEEYSRRMIRFYYQQLLGREPENEGAYTGRLQQLMNEGISANELAREFKASQEHKELLARGFIPGFAKGGMASPGLALVGEQGPELVSFGTQAHVSTASQTQGFFSGLQASIEKGDADQTNELQALVRLQSAANQQLIKEMKELKGEMAELARKAKIEAAA